MSTIISLTFDLFDYNWWEGRDVADLSHSAPNSIEKSRVRHGCALIKRTHCSGFCESLAESLL